LDEECVRAIASILPTCPNLKTLILDNNPVRYPVYHILLHEKASNVTSISLRGNQIDDDAVRYLALAVGDTKTQHAKLLNLNLSSNLIGDEGARWLARALRTNRTLLVLNLAGNEIGNAGAKAFADVISRFPLTFDEICYRRFVISGRIFDGTVGFLK
jgi:Ran GTPase-activating protein (RanGAP) involved in mRNA processing and transport